MMSTYCEPISKFAMNLNQVANISGLNIVKNPKTVLNNTVCILVPAQFLLIQIVPRCYSILRSLLSSIQA